MGSPRDGGAWWAAIYGVAQSRTELKQLKRHEWKLSGISRSVFFCTVHISVSSLPPRAWVGSGIASTIAIWGGRDTVPVMGKHFSWPGNCHLLPFGILLLAFGHSRVRSPGPMEKHTGDPTDSPSQASCESPGLDQPQTTVAQAAP